MDSLKVLEVMLRSRAAAVTPVVIEDREALRQLLRQAASCPRVRQTLMHLVSSGNGSCAEKHYAQSRQDRSERQDWHHQPSRADVVIKDDGCGQFIDQLRAHLLRLRVGGLSKQDFLLAKEMVELNTICREFCAKRGLRHVFRDLWGAVGAGRISHSSSRRIYWLLEDATIVSRVSQIIQGAVPAHACRSRTGDDCICSRNSDAPNGPQKTFFPPDVGTEEETSILSPSMKGCNGTTTIHGRPPTSSCCRHPDNAQGERCPSETLDPRIDSSNVLPLLALAEALGATVAVGECLDFIVGAQDIIADAAKENFGRTTVAVDWPSVVDRLAKWPRVSRQESVPTNASKTPPPPPPSPPPLTSQLGFSSAKIPGCQQRCRTSVENVDWREHDKDITESQTICAQDPNWGGAVITLIEGRAAPSIGGAASNRAWCVPHEPKSPKNVPRHIRSEAEANLNGAVTTRRKIGVFSGRHPPNGGSGGGDGGVIPAPRTRILRYSERREVGTITANVESTDLSRDGGREKQPGPAAGLQHVPSSPPSPPTSPLPRRNRLAHAETSALADGKSVADGVPGTTESSRNAGSGETDEVADLDDTQECNIWLSEVEKSMSAAAVHPTSTGGYTHADLVGCRQDSFDSDGSSEAFASSGRATRDSRRGVTFADGDTFADVAAAESSSDTSRCNNCNACRSCCREEVPGENSSPCTRIPSRNRCPDRASHRYCPEIGRRHGKVLRGMPSGIVKSPTTEVRRSRPAPWSLDAACMAMLAAREDHRLCIQARKRALQRLRIERRRRNIENAVTNAEEGELRIERCRRREEKVAHLQTPHLRGRDHVMKCGDRRRGASGADETNYTGMHREESRPKNSVAFAAPYPHRGLKAITSFHNDDRFRGDVILTQHRPPAAATGESRCRSEPVLQRWESAADEEETARTPLSVTPAKPGPSRHQNTAKSARSMPYERRDQRRVSFDVFHDKECSSSGQHPGEDFRRYRRYNKTYPVSIADAETATMTVKSHSAARGHQSQGIGGDVIDCVHSCVKSKSGTASPRQVVVRVDALYPLPSRWKCFGRQVGIEGVGSDGDWCKRRDELHGDINLRGVYLVVQVGRMRHQTAFQLPTNERPKEGRELRRCEADDTCWAFRETVSFHLAKQAGEARSILRIFAYLRSDLRTQSSGAPPPTFSPLGRSSGDNDPRPVAAAEKDSLANADQLVGSATLVLDGVRGETGRYATGECTFVDPVDIPLLSVINGTTIGWLGVGVCG